MERLAEDDDGDVCRICRMPAEEDQPLYYPCNCTGSIKYVHQECLLAWLKHSGNTHCEVGMHLVQSVRGRIDRPPSPESCRRRSSPAPDPVRPLRCSQVCKHKFSFTPVYASNTPTTLPVYELLMGLLLRAARGFKVAHRVSWRRGPLMHTERHIDMDRSLRAAGPAPTDRPPTSHLPPTACLTPPLVPRPVQVWVVSTLWLVVVPWATCLAWRLCFTSSLPQLRELLAQRASFLALVADCIQVGCTARRC
jgi:hypothetical protein